MTSRGYFPIWSWVIRRDPDATISDREKWPTGFQKVILSESFINQHYYKHLFNWPSVIFVRKTAKFLEHDENPRNVPTKMDKNVREVSVRVKSFDQYKYNPSNDPFDHPTRVIENQEILESVKNSSLI